MYVAVCVVFWGCWCGYLKWEFGVVLCCVVGMAWERKLRITPWKGGGGSGIYAGFHACWNVSCCVAMSMILDDLV